MPHPNCSFVSAVALRAHYTAFTHFATSHTRKRYMNHTNMISLKWWINLVRFILNIRTLRVINTGQKKTRIFLKCLGNYRWIGIYTGMNIYRLLISRCHDFLVGYNAPLECFHKTSKMSSNKKFGIVNSYITAIMPAIGATISIKASMCSNGFLLMYIS